MKKTILSVLLLLAVIDVHAQQNTWEHNIYAGGGLLVSNEYGNSTTGVSIKLGYALAYYLSNQFSLAGGVAIRQDAENLFSSTDGGDDDSFAFVDVPVTAQYHIADGSRHWVLGLGPVFSFCVQNDTYYIDADPDSPLNDQRKIKPFGLGLQPSVQYELGHFRIGVEATIGLLNVKECHGLSDGSRHLHNVMATIGYHF